MIKKVKVDDLLPGMFIHDFNCDWGGGTIFIDKMMVNDLKVVEIIKSWNIEEVYIDTMRGRDVERRRGDTRLRTTLQQPNQSSPSPGAVPLSPIPFPIEAKEALKIRGDAFRVAEETLQRLKEGKAPSVRQNYELANRMRTSIYRNNDALVLLTRIRKKDEYTLFHSIAVSSLILSFCKYRSIPETQALDLAVAALFHDIGKANVSGAILTKPGKLDDREMEIMRRHAEFSVELLRRTRNLPLECYDVAMHHHERVDGSGYPHGLTEKQIGFGAQLTAICDVFDAVTSARCYKKAMGTVAGLKMIYEGRGSHFNTELANEFILCMGVYPVGTCVQLNDGKVGLIAERTQDVEKPVVKIFHDGERKERCKPYLVDLSKSAHTILGYADPKTIGIAPDQVLNAVLAA